MDGFIAGAIIGGIIAALMVWSATSSEYRKDAVERGYAQYCPISGDWAWKGECDDR